MLSVIPIPHLAFNNGVGSDNREYLCGGGSCHSFVSAATVSMSASKLNPTVGEQITVTITVTGAEASSSPLGVFLLRSLTTSNSQPSVDGWVIVTDPSGTTAFNYYEEASVTGGVVWDWTLNAPPTPGTYNLYASEHHGNGERYTKDDATGLTFNVMGIPNNIPEAQDLTVQGSFDGSPGIMHVTSHTPDLGWTFYDQDIGDTQQQYEVRVGTAPGTSDMWSPGPQAGATSSVVYGGSVLLDGVDYWFGVTVNDGTDWSAWNETQFHMNSLAEAQSLTVQGFAEATLEIMHITDHTPDLGWSFSDPEVGDTQQEYEVRVGTAPGLSDMWSPGPQAGAATTELYAGSVLVDGTDYWFGISVYDGYEWSNWNETQFHMNSLPPTAVTPISPADDSNIPSSPAQALSWTPGGGDAEGDTITYYWFIDIDNPPTAPYVANDFTTGTTSTSFATSPSTDYYWLVNATDTWEWNATIVWNFTTSAIVNNPPEAQDLLVQSFADGTTGIMHITNHTPDLNWTFTDPDIGDTQQEYDVRVGTAAGLSDMWSPGPQAGATSSVVYAGSPLLDNVDYWFGVRVYDGSIWSNWNETQFHMNSVEAQDLTVQGFGDGTVGIVHIADHTPDLGWSFWDGELGDTQQEYEVRVGTTPGASDMWALGPQVGAASMEVYAGAALVDSTDYWFGVRLHDGYEWSVWNETHLHMNSLPPTAVTPINPADDSSIPSSPAQTLSWTSGGADPEGDAITYYWYVDTDNPPAAPYLANGTTAGTSSTSFATLPSTDYYWYVNATDGLEWNWTIVWNFTTSSIINNPPEALDLTVQGYADGTIEIMHLIIHAPELNWTFNDPDIGDTQQQYDVRVGTASGLSDMWSPGPQLGATSSVIYGGSPLIDGADYWYGVRVYDGNTWSNWNETQLHINSLPPTGVPPLTPADDSTILSDPAQILDWTSGGVDAEGDSITYYWYVGTDNPPMAPYLADGFTTGTVSTSFATLPVTDYYWYVNATDSWEWNFTIVWNFTTSAFVNNPPEGEDLTVQDFLDGSVGIMHVTDHTPDLGWTFFDLDVGDTQQQYDVRVGTASGLSDMWSPGPQAGATSSITYAGSALLDGTDYWFGVKIHDGTNWGEWNDIPFHMNSPPTLDWIGTTGYNSDGLDPESGDPQTSFSYKIMYTDPENDAPASGEPKLHIESGGTEISGSPFAMTFESGSYSTGATYTYSTTLAEGTDYSYYFTAWDDQGEAGNPTSEKNAPEVIAGDVTPPEEPTNVTVTTPGLSGKLVITWDDNDEDDLAGYNIYRSNESGGNYIQVGTVDKTVTSFTDVGLQDGKTYYYVVTAFDDSGNESPQSDEAHGEATSTPVKPDDDGDDNILWILIFVMITIIFFMIAAFLLPRQKEDEEEDILPREKQSQEPPEPEQKDSEDDNLKDTRMRD